MRILAIPLAIVVVILGLTLAPTIQARWEAHDRYKAQVEELDLLWRQQQLQDRLQQQQASAMSRALVNNMAWLGAGALLVIVVGYIGVQAQRRSDPLVRFGGELVPRRLVENGQLIEILAHRMEMQDIALIEDKRRPNVPHVFSPHWSNRSSDLQLPEPPAQLAAGSVPSFGELLNTGRIGKGNPLVLGYDEVDNTEVNGTWLDLYSTIVSGMSGTGKTTTKGAPSFTG